jgi:V/A-type H+-transporting ATPase subunit I
MRPRPAIWFELLTSREDLGGVLDCLARSGIVELETYSDVNQPDWLPEMRDLIGQFHALSESYQTYWPKPASPSEQKHEIDGDSSRKLIADLQAWASLAEPMVKEIQTLTAEESTLRLMEDWIRAVPRDGLPDLTRLSNAGPMMSARLYVLPPGQWPSSAAASLLLHKSQTPEHNFLLALGRDEQVKQMDQAIHALKGRALELPDWLGSDSDAVVEQIANRFDAIDTRRRELRGEIEQLNSTHQLTSVLAQLRFLVWVVGNVPQLSVTEHFAWVTGWTSDLDQNLLRARLEKCGHNCLVRFPPAPARSRSPMILRNPSWARPFELFARLLGTPSAGEADPSLLVAIIAPVMFGIMFGDLGQGAVLVVAGLLLRKSYPALSMLIPGGVMAMVFGLLFGSVFANETLLPALWLHPINSPLPVLIASLSLGAGVLCLGLVLDAMQAHWTGRARVWWQTRAGLVLSYVGALAALIWIPMIWVSLAGMVWFAAGHGLSAKSEKLQHAAGAIAEFAETMLQLLVNTVSFVRVGAFALAHSGLSLAIAGIGEAFDSTSATIAVYIVGNVFVLTLEALVVGIQATRLVLFEFFIRFLRAEGRAFHPLDSSENLSAKDVRRGT